MGSMESPDDGSLWEMTLGSSPIHRALTLCFVLWKYPPCEPLASRVIGTSLQSKGAPSDVSHKADVAPLLIRGGRVSAHHEKTSKLKFRKNLCTTLHGFAQIYAILFDCTADKVKILFFVLIYDTGRGRIRSVESMNKAKLWFISLRSCIGDLCTSVTGKIVIFPHLSPKI